MSFENEHCRICERNDSVYTAKDKVKIKSRAAAKGRHS